MQVNFNPTVNQSNQAFKARFANTSETKKLKVLAEIYNPHEVVFTNEILNIEEYPPYWRGTNGIKEMTMLPNEVAGKLHNLPQINKMRIESINNIIFKGNIVKNKTLDSLLRHANHKDLERLLEVSTRAAQVNDGKIFKFSHLIETRQESYGIFEDWKLFLTKNLRGCGQASETMESMHYFSTNKSCRSYDVLKNTSIALDKFLTVLEKEYPSKANYNISREELITNIMEFTV